MRATGVILRTIKDLRDIQTRAQTRLIKRVRFVEYPGMSRPTYMELWQRGNEFYIVQPRIKTRLEHWLSCCHAYASEPYRQAHKQIFNEASIYLAD